MSRRFIYYLTPVFLIVFAILAVPSGGLAQNPSPGLTMEAHPAYGGTFKNGEWLPVWVLLENNGPDLNVEIQVPVSGSMGGSIFAAQASLPAGARKLLTLYVMPNSFSRELNVQLMRGNETLLSQRVAVKPLPNVDYLLGLLTPKRGPLALLAGITLPGSERPKVLVDLSLEDIPTRAEGLASFNCLILNDIDTTTLAPEQSAALQSWVEGGGRLVIGGGAGAQRTVAGLPDSLLPFKPKGLQDVATLGETQTEGQAGTEPGSTPELAQFAKAKTIRVPGPFTLATGEINHGDILASAEGTPLVVERRLGSGFVDFISLDLVSSPFDAWEGVTDFWSTLLSPGAEYPTYLPVDMSARQVKANQMSYVLSSLPALDLPSMRGLGILLAVYIILVGPVNYFFLRWRKQLQAAWVTIPLITILFSGGAFGLGYVMRGTNLILNKIALVELPPAIEGNGTPKVTSYLGLFSPSQQSYEVEVKGNRLLAPMTQDYSPWDSSISGSPTVNKNYVVFLQGDPSRVRGLSVEQWSMQSFMTEGVWPDFGKINAELQLTSVGLEGTVRNETAYPIEDVAVIMNSQFVKLGALQPGEEKPVKLEPASDLVSLRFGPSLSYRLFEPAAQSSVFSQPDRESELKRAMVDALPQAPGGMMSNLPISKSGLGQTQAQGVFLVGWFHEDLLEVQIGDRSLLQQATSMIYAPLSYHFPEKGPVSLVPGLLTGTLVKTPENGGTCSPMGASVWMDRGQAVFEFRLPGEIQTMQLDKLELMLGSDGSLGQLPAISIFNWNTEIWRTLKTPIFGTNVITDPGQLVSKDGVVKVQISMENSSSPAAGCIYVDLGLEGRR